MNTESAKPAAMPTITKKQSALSLAWSRSKELISAGLALLGCWVVSTQVPALDPKAGVDVWGSVAAMPPVLLAAMFSWMFAYSMTTTVFRTLRDHEEDALGKLAAGMPDKEGAPAPAPRWQPVVLIAIDRVTQCGLWYVVFTRTVGQ